MIIRAFGRTNVTKTWNHPLSFGLFHWPFDCVIPLKAFLSVPALITVPVHPDVSRSPTELCTLQGLAYGGMHPRNVYKDNNPDFALLAREEPELQPQ